MAANEFSDALREAVRELERFQSTTRKATDATGPLGDALRGVGGVIGPALGQAAVQGVSTFNATGSIESAAAAGGIGFAQAMRGLNFQGIPVGELFAQVNGTAAGLNAASRTQGRIQGQFEDLARYGIEVDDQVLRENVEVSLQQERRVEQFRGRVAGEIGKVPTEGPAGSLAGDSAIGALGGTGAWIQLLQRIADGIDRLNGGGSPR